MKECCLRLKGSAVEFRRNELIKGGGFMVDIKWERGNA